MKLIRWALAAGAVSLCACSVPPSATAPTALAVDVAIADGFDPIFFRAFLQNGYESPARLEPVHVLRGPLRIYLRTQDDAGRAIDAATLDTTERVLNESAWTWSGDTFGVSEMTRGTAGRDNTPGWLTVKWAAAMPPDRCGRSTIGIDGGFIEFSVAGGCSCGLSTAIYPRLIRHELGHAMGYYHTDGAEDVMFGRSITMDSCNSVPSDRERRLARFAYTGQQ